MQLLVERRLQNYQTLCPAIDSFRTKMIDKPISFALPKPWAGEPFQIDR
jgi:hypothetical protein